MPTKRHIAPRALLSLLLTAAPVAVLIPHCLIEKAQADDKKHLSLTHDAATLEGTIIGFSSGHKRAEALRAVQSYLQTHKADLDYYLACVVGFSHGRDYNQAMKYADQGLSLYPKDMWLHYTRGKTWIDVGEPEKAEADLKFCLSLDPMSGLVHGQMSRLYSSRNEPAKALTECDLALKLEPQSAELWAIKSGILANQARYKEALVAADKGMALKDESYWKANLLRDRAALKERLGQYASAIDDYNAFFKLDRYSNVKVLVKVGNCYARLKQPQKALPYFEMALRRQADLIDAHRGKLAALEALHMTAAAAQEKKVLQETMQDFVPNRSF